MKIAVHLTKVAHQNEHSKALVSGFDRLGHEVEYWDIKPRSCVDIVTGWGWRRCEPLVEAGHNVLVIERGYLADRFLWSSLGWNGLNGRAIFPEISDPSRWKKHFSGLRSPWKRSDGYALLMGQVSDDAALMGLNITPWYQAKVDELVALGWEVRFRPHPVELQKGRMPPKLIGAKKIGGDLATALAGAGIVVTYNSNSGVDAALAGVPVYAEDEGSMAWPVAFKDLSDPKTFNRAAWCHRLAWKQWKLKEIASGEALEVVLTAMPLPT